ncbi:hypothetical protein NQT62_14135 [Limnobacter humi]|uniref:Uncharacterized protein n=1 Tax=Limnobacter humi TaxID=1778671 RepID=A0ABT1WKS0_9BURK|nr:hypothetical protein [Limnobacter humi]MCQ8897577.1 hypothetical protein [Limnobacter humi]
MHSKQVGQSPRQRGRGFVTAYLLYGLALMSVVGLAYSRLYSNNEQARIVQQTVEEVNAQIEIIRSKVFLCAAVYPNGDHAQFNARHPYPAPSNAQLNRDDLSNVKCPGSPGGALGLGQLGDGVPLPQTPPEFQPWVYEHTETNGIRLLLVPKVAGGGAVVRTRLQRQLSLVTTVSGDVLYITVLQ